MRRGRARRVVIGLSTLVAGCAMSPGILPVRPDTYTVAEHYAIARGGTVAAERVTLTEANEFCEPRGREFLPIDKTHPTPIVFGPVDYTVRFRYLPPNDPELRRPRFETSPNLVIEERQPVISMGTWCVSRSIRTAQASSGGFRFMARPGRVLDDRSISWTSGVTQPDVLVVIGATGNSEWLPTVC